MANLSTALKQLRSERDRTERDLKRLENAIAALDHLGGRGNGRRGAPARQGRRPRRKMSAAGRARIAAAQKARWAKLKARRSARASELISAAARNRTAATQRAPWAK